MIILKKYSYLHERQKIIVFFFIFLNSNYSSITHGYYNFFILNVIVFMSYGTIIRIIKNEEKNYSFLTFMKIAILFQDYHSSCAIIAPDVQKYCV